MISYETCDMQQLHVVCFISKSELYIKLMTLSQEMAHLHRHRVTKTIAHRRSIPKYTLVRHCMDRLRIYRCNKYLGSFTWLCLGQCLSDSWVEINDQLGFNWKLPRSFKLDSSQKKAKAFWNWTELPLGYDQ